MIPIFCSSQIELPLIWDSLPGAHPFHHKELMAEIAALWIEDGTAEQVLQRKGDEAAQRQRLAANILAPFSAQALPWGYHLWLELPEPWRSRQLAEEAQREGVSITPAEVFVVHRSQFAHAVRLSLSAAPDQDTLARGLLTLKQLLQNPPPTPPLLF